MTSPSDTDLNPPLSLWTRLVDRISKQTDTEPLRALHVPRPAPEWEDVAPGIACQLLANDEQRGRVGLLVRLAPGVAYPPHTHAGTEELYLLDGELWIDDRKLSPGDHYRAEPGTTDKRVWSETGCTCLLMTSLRDVLR